MVAAGFALLQLAGAGSALAAANCIKSEHKALFKIGWANIYSIPTWMKETTGTIEDMANVLKKQGLVDSLTIADAQGNANTQIQQIQSMNRSHQFRQPCRHQGPDHEKSTPIRASGASLPRNGSSSS
jgi:ABC-type sugar transport system substrate-binding protein